MTLSIFKKWWENPYEIKNSGFYQQWFFRPILTESYILFYDLHHFFESESFKRGSRRAAAMHKVHSYPGEKQSCQNALIARHHAKTSFWRQVPYENAIRVGHLNRWIFPSHTFLTFGENHDVRCNASTKIIPCRRNPQQQKALFRRRDENFDGDNHEC